MTGPTLGDSLASRESRWEQWLAERGRNPPPIAEWERDTAFVALALARFPLDMEQAKTGGYKAQHARQRLRLIHKGFRLIVDARAEAQALLLAAQETVSALSGVRGDGQ